MRVLQLVLALKIRFLFLKIVRHVDQERDDAGEDLPDHRLLSLHDGGVH